MGTVITMFETVFKGTKRMLLVPVLLSSLPLCTAQAPSPQAADQAPAPAGKSPSTVVPHRYRPQPVPKRARQYYSLIWGVDALSVRSVESGEIIRFSYRVLDAKKALALMENCARAAHLRVAKCTGWLSRIRAGM